MNVIVLDNSNDEINLSVISETITVVQIDEPAELAITLEETLATAIEIESQTIGVSVSNDTGIQVTIATQGERGPAGSVEESFESVSQNLKGWDKTLSYGLNGLESITYTNGIQTIVKTLNYTTGRLTSIELSGDTPSGISLTKEISYTGENLSSVSYH